MKIKYYYDTDSIMIQNRHDFNTYCIDDFGDLVISDDAQWRIYRVDFCEPMPT